MDLLTIWIGSWIVLTGFAFFKKQSAIIAIGGGFLVSVLSLLAVSSFIELGDPVSKNNSHELLAAESNSTNQSVTPVDFFAGDVREILHLNPNSLIDKYTVFTVSMIVLDSSNAPYRREFKLMQGLRSLSIKDPGGAYADNASSLSMAIDKRVAAFTAEYGPLIGKPRVVRPRTQADRSVNKTIREYQAKSLINGYTPLLIFETSETGGSISIDVTEMFMCGSAECFATQSKS